MGAAGEDLYPPGARGGERAADPPAEVTDLREGRTVASVLLAMVLAGAPPAGAVDVEPPATGDAPEQQKTGVPEEATLEASGARIGEIVIRVGDIFDPEAAGENHALNRLVNKIHRRTRDRVVRKTLLFRTGDPFVARKLRESERALRETGYLYDAEILPLRYADGIVDVMVETRDVWTLQGGIGFGRGGGVNSTQIGLEDKNFLGWGTSVQLRRTSTVDRTSSTFRFVESNAAGSRVRVDLRYSDNSDGALAALALGRPFYALDARWASGLLVSSGERVDSLYSRGHIQQQFGHTQELGEMSGGLSRGLARGTARRWLAGFSYEQDRFATTDSYPDPALLPGDRTLAYPWVGFETIRDRFIESHDFDHIARTEDVALGAQLRGRLGWCSTAFGADRDRLIVDLSGSSGVNPGAGQLLLFGAHASGRLASGQNENLLLGGTVRYFLRDWGRHALAVSFRGDVARSLDADQQLLLGGDNGLRGYPLRYQDGDRLVLLTIEQRFYTDWHPLKLLRVGAAAFFDTGRAWFRGDPGSDRDGSGILRDVGLGLRIGSSRSATASLVHVDVAVPLDGDPSISRIQLLVSSKGTF